MNDPIVGIDLGTTNSVVAAVDAEGNPRVLADERGFKVQPSVVTFHPNGSVIVGAEAKQRRIIDPQNTVYSAKRLIGRSFRSPEVTAAAARMPYRIKEGVNEQPVVATRAGEFAIPEVSAIVLDHMRSVARRALDTEINRCVVTVPANFTDAQRSATATAGAIAGLTVVRVLNEPTAAALAYGHRKRLSQNIAVYDFGGGTFDVTVLRLRESIYEVLGTAGDSFLGGDDLDEQLVEHMVERFLAAERVDLRTDPIAMSRLRAVAEQTKIELSRRTRAIVKADEIAYGPGGAPIHLELEITRAQLEQLTGAIIARTFPVCTEALQIAGMSPAKIDEVVLVGGTTKMPLIREQVARFFGRAPRTDINPEEAVGLGAALQGVALERVLGAQPRITARAASVPPAPPMGQRSPAPPPAATPARPTAPRIAAAIEDTATDTAVAPDPQSTLEGGWTAGDPDLGSMGLDEEPTQARPRDEEPPQQLGLDEEPTQARPRRDSAPPVDDEPAPRPTARPHVAAVSPPRPPTERPARPGNHSDSFQAIPVPPPGAPMARITRPGPAPSPRVTQQMPPPIPPASRGAGANQPGSRTMFSALPPVPPAPARSTSDFGDTSTGAPTRVADEPPTTERPKPTGAADPFAGKGLFDDSTEISAVELLPPEPTAVPLDFDTGPAAPAGANPLDEPATRPAASVGPAGIGPAGPGDRTVVPPVAPPPHARAPRAEAGAQTLLAGSFGPGPGAPASPASPPPASSPPGAPWGAPDAPTMVPAPQPVPAAPAAAPQIMDVTPHSLGIATVAGYCESIIRRNARVPTETRRTFATSRDQQQTVRIRVCQGESRRIADNVVLGDLVLDALEPRPRGQTRIEVTFLIDASGILRVRARDIVTGQEQQADLHMVGAQSPAEIQAAQARLRGLRS